jgi:hypothetical protein
MHKDSAVFFKERPYQWGLRGDPHLWNGMGVVSPEFWMDKVISMMRERFEKLRG